jgi:hypothetical protein
MASDIRQLLLPGRLLLTLGFLFFLYALANNAALVSCDFLVSGAVLIAGVKISYSIDQFRKSFEDRQSA